VYTISYQAIAVTGGELIKFFLFLFLSHIFLSGKFLLPSTKAWLIGTPEVFGISLSGEVTVSGGLDSSPPKTTDTPTQSCLLTDLPSDGDVTYGDPIPPGGYPQIWDVTNLPAPSRPLFTIRLVGVGVFALVCVAIVMGVLRSQYHAHSGYSKFRPIELESTDGDVELDLTLE
jgi:hypothetical protein